MERNKPIHIYLTRRDNRMIEGVLPTDRQKKREAAHVYLKRGEHQPVHVYFPRLKATHVHTRQSEHTPLHIYLKGRKAINEQAA